MLAEPAFSRSAASPPFGFDGLPPEPDDPGPAASRDTLRPDRHLPERGWLAGPATLDRPTAELLHAIKPVAASRRQAWKVALLVSCLLHAAVALAFLGGAADRTEIAGSDQAGMMLLGNATDDQLASGDAIEATNVTLVAMLDARPVATVAAERVTAVETTRPVRETVRAVEVVSETVTSPPAERVAEADSATLRPSGVDPAETEVEVAAVMADPAPEVLTAQAEEPAQTVPPAHVEQSTAIASETVTPTIPARQPDAAAETAVQVETAVAETPARRIEPIEETRSAEKPKPAPEKPTRKAEKKAPAKAVEKAEKPRKTRKTVGSGGSNKTDSRRGVADGRADGSKEAAGKGGKASAAGNAAASNYPGKVAAKLRRAVRGVSRPARARARGDVLVSFTVNAGGGLGGVRIARSSGSPELDQAALAVVRRAAPFPPIPPESGRRNWAFTLPLGLH